MWGDGLVPVGHEGREPIDVEGDALVRVPDEDGELHGDGHEWWRSRVEAEDGGAGYFEVGFGGFVGKPDNEDYDAE